MGFEPLLEFLGKIMHRRYNQRGLEKVQFEIQVGRQASFYQPSSWARSGSLSPAAGQRIWMRRAATSASSSLRTK
jgi:hypothetical protein